MLLLLLLTWCFLFPPSPLYLPLVFAVEHGMWVVMGGDVGGDGWWWLVVVVGVDDAC